MIIHPQLTNGSGTQFQYRTNHVLSIGPNFSFLRLVHNYSNFYICADFSTRITIYKRIYNYLEFVNANSMLATKCLNFICKEIKIVRNNFSHFMRLKK